MASLLIWLSIGTQTPALAEERTGPMLGLAIGPSNHFVESTVPDFSAIVFDPIGGDTNYIVREGGTSRANSGSLSVQLQLGYSFSSRFQAYFVQVMELEAVSALATGSNRQVYAFETIRALGVDYHPGHKAGPWFLGGAAGLSSLGYTEGSALAWMVEGGRDIGKIAQVRLTLTHSHHERDGYLSDGYTVAALFGLHWG